MFSLSPARICLNPNRPHSFALPRPVPLNTPVPSTAFQPCSILLHNGPGQYRKGTVHLQRRGEIQASCRCIHTRHCCGPRRCRGRYPRAGGGKEAEEEDRLAHLASHVPCVHLHRRTCTTESVGQSSIGSSSWTKTPWGILLSWESGRTPNSQPTST